MITYSLPLSGLTTSLRRGKNRDSGLGIRHRESVAAMPSRISNPIFFVGVSAAFALAFACPAVNADTGVGVDSWHANKLDPTAGTATQETDERGTSWLTAGQHRSPTGNLYMCPAEPPEVSDHGEWQSYGILEIGAVATGGDDDNALWNRYVHWDSGLILGLLDYTWERPDDGTYANVRASRISDDDEYYQAVFGRAGSYKIQAFLRDVPNELTNTARPIWNGVGTNNLTLPSSLTPGASTSAEVAAVSAATPERTLSVKRDKQGLGFSMYLTPQWTAYANVTDEQRKGARPYGGPFFFNYPFPDNGGVLETVKPIDDSTINVNGGFRYAGPVWRMDFGYQGSFYRDRYTRYTYQSPFSLSPVTAGCDVCAAVSGPDGDGTGQRLQQSARDIHAQAADERRALADRVRRTHVAERCADRADRLPGRVRHRSRRQRSRAAKSVSLRLREMEYAGRAVAQERGHEHRHDAASTLASCCNRRPISACAAACVSTARTIATHTPPTTR